MKTSNFLQKLQNWSDLESLKPVLLEMRDNIEFIHQPAEQETFMKKILPMFLRFLLEMRSGDNEYTCRQIILEMIYRLPSNDSMKECGNNLLNCLIKIMKDDYEDNAIMAIKILNEQYKQFRNFLGEEPKVSFIKFAESMFKRFHEIAAAGFERGQFAPPKKQSEPFTEQEEDKKSLVRSQSSFKVLIECSTVITIMYQLFQQNFPINTFIDLAMQVLSNQTSIKCNQSWVFKDYVTCKTKILSFLAYFIRTDSMRDQIMRHGKELAKAVMDMFDTFPHDMFQVRKDMFMALRHIVQTNVRESFLVHTDTILNEKKMLGSCEADLIKSYWFSSIMDFIQFSKHQFNLKQIGNAVSIILNNLQDISLQPFLQQNSLKMIIYIVDNLKSHNEMDQNHIHQILVQILTCITKNFVLIKNQIREKLQIINKNQDKQSVSQANENLKDFKVLLRQMLNSLKVVV